MGARLSTKLTYLEDANRTRDSDSGESKDGQSQFGVCGMQGWRRGMEDAHLADCNFDVERGIQLFGVFDGHGGRGVSRFAAKHLPDLIRNNENYKKGDYGKALEESFLEIDTLLDAPEGRKEVILLDRKTDEEKKATSLIRLSKRELLLHAPHLVDQCWTKNFKYFFENSQCSSHF